MKRPSNTLGATMEKSDTLAYAEEVVDPQFVWTMLRQNHFDFMCTEESSFPFNSLPRDIRLVILRSMECQYWWILRRVCTEWYKVAEELFASAARSRWNVEKNDPLSWAVQYCTQWKGMYKHIEGRRLVSLSRLKQLHHFAVDKDTIYASVDNDLLCFDAYGAYRAPSPLEIREMLPVHNGLLVAAGDGLHYLTNSIHNDHKVCQEPMHHVCGAGSVFGAGSFGLLRLYSNENHLLLEQHLACEITSMYGSERSMLWGSSDGELYSLDLESSAVSPLLSEKNVAIDRIAACASDRMIVCSTKTGSFWIDERTRNIVCKDSPFERVCFYGNRMLIRRKNTDLWELKYGIPVSPGVCISRAASPVRHLHMESDMYMIADTRGVKLYNHGYGILSARYPCIRNMAHTFGYSLLTL